MNSKTKALKSRTMYHLYEHGEKVAERPDKDFGVDLKRVGRSGKPMYSVRAKHLKVKSV